MASHQQGVGRLDVTADLSFTVDGVSSTVTGSGSDLRVETSDPARLLDALAHAALPAAVGRVDGPRALGRVADQLRSTGVRVTVSGPGGDALTMGDVAPSWTGRVVTGSDAVRMGRWSAVRPLVGAAARRRLPLRRAVAGGAGVVAAGLVARLVRRSRRPTGS